VTDDKPLEFPVGEPTLILGTSEDASLIVQGEQIKGTTQTFVQLVPSTGEAAIIGSNTSRSFARSTTSIRAFDDRLFLLNVAETGARIAERGPGAVGADRAELPIPTPRNFDSVADRCTVVIGDDLFFKVGGRQSRFPGIGFEDGPLVVVPGFYNAATQGPRPLELIAGIGGDALTPNGFVTDACFFGMDFADGDWFDVRVDRDDVVRFYRRDVASGKPTELRALQFGPLGGNIAVPPNFAFDRGSVYFARLAPSGVLQIVRAGLFDAALELLVNDDVNDLGVTDIGRIDADDGHVAIVLESGGRRSLVYLFDSQSGDIDVRDVGISVNDLALIVADR
jgi:hypothetical protein